MLVEQFPENFECVDDQFEVPTPLTDSKSSLNLEMIVQEVGPVSLN